MISYNDLYEILRKEKYSETLQPLPKNFLRDFSEYVNDKSSTTQASTDLFADSVAKSKKQLENAISLFKELILRRKKKLLSLVFVATETGIMKRDYENMLSTEKETFDRLVKAFEDHDKEIARQMAGEVDKRKEVNKMVIFREDTDELVDPSGKTIGPFKTGELANLEADVASLLAQSGKATFVDED